MQILIRWYFPGKSESILVNVASKLMPQRGYLIWLVWQKGFSYSYLQRILLYRVSFLRKPCKLILVHCFVLSSGSESLLF